MKELTYIVKNKSDPRYKLYVSGCLTKKYFDSKDDGQLEFPYFGTCKIA